jgi:signal transduction histidine kinase
MTALGPEALDLLRRRVVNVVGHELRTPLTTVRGLAELLDGASDEELRETLIPALVRNARRAERLLDDLLIAGEIDTALPTTPADAVDLAPLVADAVEGTDLVVTGSPDGDVRGHRDGIAHALGHLVTNALQYGDGPPSVRFEHDGDAVTVAIDTPVDRPLPPGDLDLCFELFFRGEQAVTRAAGLGVGLPIARSLAHMDGGDVTIEQHDGTITTRLTLPRSD